MDTNNVSNREVYKEELKRMAKKVNSIKLNKGVINKNLNTNLKNNSNSNDNNFINTFEEAKSVYKK